RRFKYRARCGIPLASICPRYVWVMKGARAPECEQRRGLLRTLVWPLQQFAGVEGASGIVLVLAVAAAMAWANTPVRPGYETAWAAALAGAVTPRFIVNDVLM